MRNQLEKEIYETVAKSNSLTVESVRTIVSSFFGVIEQDARHLPFNNPSRIYTRTKFDEYVIVTNIPYIGRIGPSYSRYLKWRANATSYIEKMRKENYNSRLTPDEIEDIAQKILSGESIKIEKKKTSELYKRVWLVGKSGKRQARQVIPKTKENGI